MRIFQYIFVGISMLVLGGCSSASAPATTRVIKLNNTPERDTARARDLNQRAANLIAKADYGGAEDILNHAVMVDPDFGPARNNLGVVYYNETKLYAAAQQFLLAAGLLPHDPEPRNGLGLVFESSHRFDDAITYYDRARVLDPGNSEYLANSARAHVRRGDQTEEVRGMLQSIAANDPRTDWNQWAHGTLRHMARASATEPEVVGTSASTAPSAR